MAVRTRTRVTFVLVLVVAAAVVLGVYSYQEQRGYLDPEGIDAWGARAVVRVLEEQGVQVTGVRTTDAAAEAADADSTLLVTIPDLLRPAQVERLLDTGADIVLASPSSSITDFSGQVTVAGQVEQETREPGCDLPEARLAGSARTGGLAYAVGDGGVSCYPADDAGGSLVVVTLEDGARLTVLGTADALVNGFLDEDGNAALALNLLGHNPDLVWYWPALEALDEADAAPGELLPGWVTPVAWQLGVAGLLAALWRGRRLGPVVAERLPVIVRASETTEGRARLYRRGRARGHAAATLREATVHRLRSRLGLPPDVDVNGLADLVAVRSHRTAQEVRALLDGPEPADDAGLVRLADDLDTLEQEVRTP